MSATVDTGARATIVMTARDRFSLAPRALETIVEHTPRPYELIYVDGGSPREIAGEIEAICGRNGFRYVREDHFLSPCQSRNIGHRLTTTPYVVYVENDVMVSPGWLDKLVECADATGAEVVQPLICQGAPLHTEIHQAGGDFTDDLDAFFNGPEEKRRLCDNHLMHQGKRVDEVNLRRSEMQVTEVHSFLVRKDAFARLGDFDENMPCSKDHVDFSITVHSKGGRIMLEPESVVTFCVPSRHFPIEAVDRAYFLLRWSPQWQRQSLSHFQKKWGLENDPYFDRYLKLTGWRYREGVAKPLVRKLPLVGHSYKVQQAGSRMLMPLLQMMGSHIVRRNARCARPAAHFTPSTGRQTLEAAA